MFFTAIIFIIVLSILILVHEFGHFLVAKLSGVRVEEFGLGFPPRLANFKLGETRYSLNWIFFGGFVRLYGEEGEHKEDSHSFAHKNIWTRFCIIIFGVLMNLILAGLVLSIGFSIGMSPLVSNPKDFLPKERVQDRLIIVSVMENSVAQSANLKSGDEIISINGQKITEPEEFRNFTTAHRGQEVELTFLHNGVQKTQKVTLAQDTQKGALGVFTALESKVKLPFWKAIPAGFWETAKTTWYVIVAIGSILKNLIIKAQIPADITGPVGIFTLTGQVARLGFVYLLQFLALLSINLGIINILPFPALDGGKVLFLGIEAIRRGRKVPVAVENLIHTIGFVLLIILILAITYRDIIRMVK